MSPSVTDIEARVKKVVADALDVSVDQVHAHASLVADLNAESIDFLDLTYRLESEFDVRIPEEEIWRGSVDATDDASIARSIAQLRLRMPDFPWNRLPERVTRADLPELITVQTIVDYLVRKLDGASL